MLRLEHREFYWFATDECLGTVGLGPTPAEAVRDLVYYHKFLIHHRAQTHQDVPEPAGNLVAGL